MKFAYKFPQHELFGEELGTLGESESRQTEELSELRTVKVG